MNFKVQMFRRWCGLLLLDAFQTITASSLAYWPANYIDPDHALACKLVFSMSNPMHLCRQVQMNFIQTLGSAVIFQGKPTTAEYHCEDPQS